MKQLVDMATSKALAHWLQREFEQYVEVKSVMLDSRATSCVVSFLPHGEIETVELTIAPYALQKGEQGYQVKAEGVQCTRVWLERLVSNYLIGKAYPVPSIMAKLL